MVDRYVIDANFFISLSQTHIPGAIETALERSAELGWELHTTERILGEVRTVHSKRSRATAADLARATMGIARVDKGDIAKKRMALGGGHRAPQSPDLSLMVLAEGLSTGGDRVRLVSDDFKISTSSRELAMPFTVISPSVYLFSLAQKLRGKPRNEVRHLYRKVRHGEMEYLLSRRDVYNVEEKLTWLMDNLLHSVTEPGAAPPRGGAKAAPGVGAAGDDEASWRALMRHLRGERVRASHLGRYKGLLPHLEPLVALNDKLVEIHALADAGDLEAALARAHGDLSELKSQLQLKVGGLDREAGQGVLRAYAELLPGLEMVTALLHVNLGDVVDCEDHLDNVALFALAAGLMGTSITANYLEALVHAYREAWDDALAQFDLTARLSRQTGMEASELRCLVGAAVTRFLAGDREGAEATMEEVNVKVERDPASGSTALEEFGDHFTNFGAIHLAVGMYDEALECAVEAGDSEGADRLLRKVRRSHLSMGLEHHELAGAVQTLIDHANDIQDDELRARYEELKRGLHESEAAMEGPLPELVPDWSDPSRLPGELREWMDIIRAEGLPDGEGTLLVCYAWGLGKVGLLIKDYVSLPGIEQATVRVGPSSRVRLVEPPEPLGSRHRLRAIVVLEVGGRYDLRRSLISLGAP